MLAVSSEILPGVSMVTSGLLPIGILALESIQMGWALLWWGSLWWGSLWWALLLLTVKCRHHQRAFTPKITFLLSCLGSDRSCSVSVLVTISSPKLTLCLSRTALSSISTAHCCGSVHWAQREILLKRTFCGLQAGAGGARSAPVNFSGI